jgi:HEAT repeat protein
MPCMGDRLKLFAIGLLTISLMACSLKKVWYRLRPQDMAWYQQDTPDSVVRSDLDACRSVADDPRSIGHCMQAKGYLLIPRSEKELLRVRSLQDEDFSAEEIAATLHWNKKKVKRFMNEEYELSQSASLGRQPVDVLTDIGKPAVNPLVAALKDNHPLVRRHAAEALGEIKDPRAVEPLIAALKDSDSLIRRHVVEALGKIGDLRAIKPLIAVLNEDRESHVRMSAAEALGRIGEPSVAEALISALKDKHWSVRSCSAKVLGKIKDPLAVEPLVSALKDEDATVRGYAADALGEIKDARAVAPLVATLQDQDRNVRKRAAQALTNITGKEFGNNPFARPL